MNKNRYITGIVGLMGLFLVLSTSLGVGMCEEFILDENTTYGNWTWFEMIMTVSNTSDTSLYIYPDVYHARIGYYINETWMWVNTTWTAEGLAEKYYNLYRDTLDELDRIREQLFWTKVSAAVGLTAIIGILVITNRRKVTEKEVTSCETAKEGEEKEVSE